MNITPGRIRKNTHEITKSLQENKNAVRLKINYLQKQAKTLQISKTGIYIYTTHSYLTSYKHN